MVHCFEKDLQEQNTVNKFKVKCDGVCLAIKMIGETNHDIICHRYTFEIRHFLNVNIFMMHEIGFCFKSKMCKETVDFKLKSTYVHTMDINLFLLTLKKQ